MNFLKTKFIFFIYFTFLLSIISVGFEKIDFIYFLLPILIGILISYLILYKKENKFKFGKESILIFLFPIYIILSSLWSLQPTVTLLRSLYYLFLFVGIISIIKIADKENFEILFRTIFIVNLLVIIICFASLILGFPDDRWTGGNGMGFKGLAKHQNTLGSILMMTSVGGVFFMKAKLSKVLSNLLITIFFLTNLFLIYLSASRASLISYLLFWIPLLILTIKDNFISFIIASSTIILFIVFNYHSTEKFIKKGNSSILDNRIHLWRLSYNSIIKPICGIGYGTSFVIVIDKKNEIRNFKKIFKGYNREKGNSILALIEETGFIGLLLFLIPIISVLISAIYNFNINFNLDLFVVSVYTSASLFHAQFEAWFVGTGSVQLPIFLLFVISSILSKHHQLTYSKKR